MAVAQLSKLNKATSPNPNPNPNPQPNPNLTLSGGGEFTPHQQNI